MESFRLEGEWVQITNSEMKVTYVQEHEISLRSHQKVDDIVIMVGSSYFNTDQFKVTPKGSQ